MKAPSKSRKQKRRVRWSEPFHQFTGWSKDLTDALWYARVSVFTLLLLFGALWIMNQGHDIIVSMSEHWRHAVLTYLLTAVLGLLNWYFPRLIFPSNAGRYMRLLVILRDLRRGSAEFLVNRASKPCGDFTKGRIFDIGQARREPAVERPQENQLFALLPRFLGVFTVLLVAAAIFRVWLLSHPDWYEALNGTLIGNSAFHLLLTITVAAGINRFTYRYRHRLCPNRVFFPLLTTLVVIVVGLAFFTNKDLGLSMLALGMMLVAVIWSLIFTLRTENPWLQKYLTDAVITLGLAIVTTVLFLTFIIHNLMSSASGVFPYVVVLCAITFYLTLINGLLLLGQRLNTYVLNLVVIVLITLTTLWDLPLHDIRLIAAPPVQRVTIDEYLDRWLADRAGDIEAYYAADSLPYPIFVVAGEGGGSRAAYWTNLVLSTLEDRSDGAFSRHCFAITSASGSSFGSATFMSYLSEGRERNDRTPIIDDRYHRYTFERNYLSTSLTMFLGADFWRTVLPFTYYIGTHQDRAVALEHEWTLGVERGLRRDTSLILEAGAGRLQQPFRSLWYDAAGAVRTDLPLFIPNTTSVLKGTRGIISPVRFDTAIQHNALDLEGELTGNEDFSLATATLLSARFPLINPAGQLNDRDQFVDGGYYDNIGGTTAYEIIRSLRSRLATLPDSLARHCEINLLLILNNDYRAPMMTRRPVVQLVAPLTALANTPFTGHTEYWAEMLTSEADRTYRLYLDHGLPVDNKRVIMPLARYLSKTAAEGIRRNVEEGQFLEKKNGKILEEMVRRVGN